jgi:hypothetical protein
MNRKPAAFGGVELGRRVFLSVLVLGFCSVSHAQTVLLNDSFASGNRTTSSGVVQPVYVGASTSDNTVYFNAGTEVLNDAVNTVPGKMQNLVGTGSRKIWTYFTPDGQAPDSNNPPSDFLSMQVGQTLTATTSFVIPSTVYTTGNVPGPSSNTLADLSASGAKKTDLRFGLFYDPGDYTATPPNPPTTFARILTDTNNDSGTVAPATTTPWEFSQGYMFSIPIGTNASSLQASETQIGKRTNNTGGNDLMAHTGNFVLATTGGTAVSETFNQVYTVQIQLHEVSATHMDVTANVYQGSATGTPVSTNTVSDIGTGDPSLGGGSATFGGVAIVPGTNANAAVVNNTSIFTNFDQMFFRLNGSNDTKEFDITNMSVTLSTPSSILLGDMNFDGHVDAKDIAALQLALTNENGYLSTNFGNGTPSSHGLTTSNIGQYSDVTGGNTFNNSNIQALLTYLKAGHGSSTAVPEPASFVLAGLGAAAMGLLGWRRRKAV